MGRTEERSTTWQSGSGGVNVLITSDQSLEHQQNLATRKLGIVVLSAVSNALEDLLPLLVNALFAIERIQPGQVIRVTL